jgi:hypothetical protein
LLGYIGSLNSYKSEKVSSSSLTHFPVLQLRVQHAFRFCQEDSFIYNLDTEEQSPEESLSFYMHKPEL